MDNITLFDNLIKAPKETRDNTINNFAALMNVDAQTVHTLLICYSDSQLENADEMELDMAFTTSSNFCAADAVRILDAAGVRSGSVLLDVDGDSTAALKIVHAFLTAGWRVSATTVSIECEEERPALRLSRV